MPLAHVVTDRVGYYREQQLILYGSGFTSGDLDFFLLSGSGTLTLIGSDPVLQNCPVTGSCVAGLFTYSMTIPDSAPHGASSILVKNGAVAITTVPILIY